jgi:hypothetical protein
MIELMLLNKVVGIKSRKGAKPGQSAETQMRRPAGHAKPCLTWQLFSDAIDGALAKC